MSPATGSSARTRPPAASKIRAVERQVDQTLRAVADSTRRGILARLGPNEHAAGEIAAWFPTITRPAVSQHLAILETAALVEVRKAGNRRLYRVRAEGLAPARASLEQLWRASLQRLKVAAERAEHGPRAGVLTEHQ